MDVKGLFSEEPESRDPKAFFDDALTRSVHDKNDLHFIGESLPAPDEVNTSGTATVGTSAIPARADHSHGAGGGVNDIALLLACTDETSYITTTGVKFTYRAPQAFTLTGVRGSLTTACSTGTFTVDIHKNGTSVLSTKLTFDAGEETTVTAATAAVIGTDEFNDDDEITIEVDDVGDAGARGLKVTLFGTLNVNGNILSASVTDGVTAISTTGVKQTFRMPKAMTVTRIKGSLTSACTTGTLTVDINESGTTILSTKMTFDAGETTTETAATPLVISDSNLADDAEITIDVDNTGDGTAKGLKIYLIGAFT